MESEMMSNGTPATVMAVRRWLTLEQLLEVLPVKKSYVYYLTHTRQIPVTRIGRRLLFDYDRIVEWLEERTVEDGAYLIRGENGQWYAKYRKSDGKWTHHSLRTPNKATAQVRFGHFLKQLEERDLLFSEVRPLRLSEFSEEYLRHVKSHKSASWHRKQQYYIQGTILPFFGPDMLTTQITSRKIEQYAESRRATVKGTTVNKELACIRHMMKKAEEWGHLASSPARKVKDLPDDGQVHERFLMPDEYALMLSRASLNSFEPWTLPNDRFEDLREFIMLDCNTGLRVSEVLTLEFADVEWDRRVLRVRNKPHLNFHVKNYQERHIRLNSHAYTALQSMLEKRHPHSDFVFHRKDGGRWTTIHDSFNALVRRCDLQADAPFNVTLHTLRHTFGSWLAIRGVPLRAIQKLMGHKSIVTTERYAHLSGESLTSAVQKLEGFLPNSLPSNEKNGANGAMAVPVSPTNEWCGGRESNPHGPCGPRDFKSLASTSSATPAR